jgi:hypothetical protein
LFVPPRDYLDGLLELVLEFFLLPLPALAADVVSGDELDIDLFGALPHSFGVGADAVLHADAGDLFGVGGAHSRGQLFDVFKMLVLR